LVTGAASGIGRCVTDRLAARGHRVLATDIDRAALEKQAGGWGERVLLDRLDVTDPESWARAIAACCDAWGGIDVLYNIAGFLQPGYIHEIEPKDVDRHFDINVKGVAYGMRYAAAQMVRQESGHIVNIASMASYAPVPGIALYCASKYAVRALSLAAATELSAHDVAVTVVCPDAVATPMLDKQRDYEEAALTFTAPRVLSADEVADRITGSVLRDRPLEVAMPRSRKWLGRIVDLVPQLGRHVDPLFRKQGVAKQRRAKKS
jgi:3-oxoacyl-[acyl-carrier protein] reductase